jgi:hypothetical protein
VVEDLGYTDYAWYNQLTTQRIFFVTRQKRNAAYEVLERRDVNKSRGLLSDQTIRLIGVKPLKCPFSLRRITYLDPASGKRHVFLTNRLKLSAKTIADIYKEPWQIEIFFRWFKQNLRIRAFNGNSKNAVLTQIVAALSWSICCFVTLSFYATQGAKIASDVGFSWGERSMNDSRSLNPYKIARKT